MKKIVASVGLVALGVAGAHGEATDLSAPTVRPWNISATLRGFYDDNYATTATNNSDSFGFEVSPGVKYGWGNGQTTLVGNYLYSLKYYDVRRAGEQSKTSQQHLVNVGFTHAFTERYNLEITESFAIGQEPDVLRSEDSITTHQTIPGNNIRNSANILLSAQLTPLFGLDFGYNNSFYDYTDDTTFVDDGTGTNFVFWQPSTVITGSSNVLASRSAVLDRVENGFHIDANWNVGPETVAYVGYALTLVSFTGDSLVAIKAVPENPAKPGIFSDSGDSISHRLYGGMKHSFNPELYVTGRAGVDLWDQYNLDLDGVSPYVELSLAYSYLPDCVLQLGFNQTRAATDQLNSRGHVVRSADTSVVFGRIHHRILPRLYGDLTATFQNASFDQNGPEIAGGAEDITARRDYLLGMQLEYRFNRHFSAHFGYNFDRQETDVGETFTRNRVYIGATATY